MVSRVNNSNSSTRVRVRVSNTTTNLATTSLTVETTNLATITRCDGWIGAETTDLDDADEVTTSPTDGQDRQACPRDLETVDSEDDDTEEAEDGAETDAMEAGLRGTIRTEGHGIASRDGGIERSAVVSRIVSPADSCK